MDLTSLLAGWVTGQADAAAQPWVEYLVYGGIGLVLLIVVARALRAGPPPERTLDAPDGPQIEEREKRSQADIEADAAAAFNVLKVTGTASEDVQVKVLSQDEAPPPTGDAEAEAEAAARAAAAAAKREAELARREADQARRAAEQAKREAAEAERKAAAAAKDAADEESRRLAEQQQREAEEKKRKAEAAAAKAAEEKKRADDERKRAAEEKRRAAEERKRAAEERKRRESEARRQAAEAQKKAAADAAAKAEQERLAAEKAAEEQAAAAQKKAEEAAGKTLREGLARTNEGFVKKLGKLFGGAKTLDDDLLGELEEALFTADIGVRTAQKLVEGIYEDMSKRALKDPAKVWKQLKARIAEILEKDFAPVDLETHTPTVIMVVGVNGAGKTTSIGKLAKRYTDAGKKVLLAAGDTFRAAAVEQLEVWGERAGVEVVKGKERQDPSSVLFDAARRAREGGYDLLIADTAGRLQARKELMEELAKIHRVMGKAMPGAPHEVWIVLDATNGQNAISQAKIFTEMVDVTGIVLTKLDGTAKGGVVIGISDEMNLPVRFIGIGEKVGDLRPFEASEFVEALFAEE